MTAAEKLTMLSTRAAVRLMVAHFQLRAAMGKLDDTKALREGADELSRMAWEVERKRENAA
jgi:hypothetical protein